MMAESSQSDPSPEFETSLCEVCTVASALYKCPACSVQTCSLPCVKQHKALTGCTGKRERTAFVPMAAFTEHDLRSDFNLLEGVSLEIGRAKRARDRDVTASEGQRRPMHRPLRMAVTDMDAPDDGMDNREPGTLPLSTLTPALNKLKKRAIELSGVTLLLMPAGMSRRQHNTTCIDGRILLWHIEFLFQTPQGRRHVCVARANENETWGALLLSHVVLESPGKSVQRHELRAYREALEGPGVRLYLQREPAPASNVLYFEVDASDTIKHTLSGKTIIEFPCVHVVFHEDASKFPKVPSIVEEIAQVPSRAETGDLGGTERACTKSADSK
jgi:hypothetical protein